MGRIRAHRRLVLSLGVGYLLNTKIGTFYDECFVTICSNCARENNQSGATFCAFCGSSLQKGDPSESTTSTIISQKGPDSYDIQRLEKATKRVERLGYFVAIELVALLGLLLFLYYTFYG